MRNWLAQSTWPGPVMSNGTQSTCDEQSCIACSWDMWRAFSLLAEQHCSQSNHEVAINLIPLAVMCILSSVLLDIACHADIGLQHVLWLQLCCCFADPNYLMQFAAGCKTCSHVRCVLDAPGTCRWWRQSCRLIVLQHTGQEANLDLKVHVNTVPNLTKSSYGTKRVFTHRK